MKALVAKLSVNKVAFILATVAFMIQSVPKPVVGLRLNLPIEGPDGVMFSWVGGQVFAVYSLYRREVGTEDWERIAMNLSGVVGVVEVPGFTLDRDYEYELRLQWPP